MLSCGSDAGDSEFQSTSVTGEISNAELIRNPVSVEGTADTINVAKLAFAEPVFNFGTVKAGEVVNKTFTFTNTGKVPLVITDARSTCGCTVADYPEHLILPGKKGKVTVNFDTKNKSGKQHKPVTLTANTYPATTQVIMKGIVEE